RWFEIGRTELFRSLGLPYTEIEKKGYFLPVSETHCKFKTFADIFANGYTRHAFLDSTGKLVRTPKFIREFIAEKIGER
ncbi:MAG: hypothetical protein JRJ27_22345, partial [Deltaproteobacteria bacterium]|nr:hypothetical protein [Deltaproteobacteria bacterium]